MEEISQNWELRVRTKGTVSCSKCRELLKDTIIELWNRIPRSKNMNYLLSTTCYNCSFKSSVISIRSRYDKNYGVVIERLVNDR